MSSPRPELRLDWCSHAAAKYAVEHWHYSQTPPVGKATKIGVWEDGEFIGALIYGAGGGAATNGQRYGLRRAFDIAELERVALRHHRSPVTRIVAIANRMMSRQSPGLRAIVSYADPGAGHHGGIYQGGNWFYVGLTPPDWCIIDKNGRRWHSRVVQTAAPKMQFGRAKSSIRAQDGERVVLPGKHKYLYPLDDAMRAQLAPLAKPYPKRASEPTSVGTGDQPGQGGATPTRTLEDEDAP